MNLSDKIYIDENIWTIDDVLMSNEAHNLNIEINYKNYPKIFDMDRNLI